MRQIVYISTISPRAVGIDVDTLLAVSQRNNARHRVTGLLFFDGKRFLQALEGDDAAVAATFARIEQDGRHRAVVVLSDRVIPAREFGEWAMAYRPDGEGGGDAVARISSLAAEAAPAVRATFESFAKMRRAA